MGFFSSIGKAFKKVVKPVVGATIGGLVGGPAGAIAGAGAGLLSDANSSAQQDMYNQQMGFSREQYEFQKAYLQNQLQWRVEDAKKAGLHPMAVLGINGASFSPVSTPSIPSLGDSIFDPAELGQSVAYAATKAKTNKQQEQAFELAQATGSEQLRGVQLDNELKMLEIMSLSSRLTQTGPAAPSLISNLGQPDAGYLDEPITSNGFRLDERGRKVDIIPSDDLKSRTEDVFGVEWMPFIDSAKLNWRTKVKGEPFAGHWWHEDRGEYLPYPPKRSKDVKHNNQSSYYSNSYRYR